jgi:hypothetical protein
MKASSTSSVMTFSHVPAAVPENSRSARSNLDVMGGNAKALVVDLDRFDARRILARARMVVSNALSRVGAKLVPARKPYLRRYTMTLAEALRKYGTRILNEDNGIPFREPDSGPRYLKTIHPRWLIALPECFPRDWVDREIVHDAAMLLEDIWSLRYELARPMPNLQSLMFCSMQIAERCERLSQRRFIELFVGKKFAEDKRAAHRASVESRREYLEQTQRPWANEVYTLRKRLGLMAACRRVARKHNIGIRRMHQIYRTYFPRLAEF